MSKEMKKYREGVVERAKKLDKREMGLLQDMLEQPVALVLAKVLGDEFVQGVNVNQFRRGGLVQGMAQGDQPVQPAQFVGGGPPEQFSKSETVADDQMDSVRPDTFIINAPAVEIAGSEDIRKMLMKAYEVAVEKGLDIGRVDRKLYEGTIDVALSKGEVKVPPELVKVIGEIVSVKSTIVVNEKSLDGRKLREVDSSTEKSSLTGEKSTKIASLWKKSVVRWITS